MSKEIQEFVERLKDWKSNFPIQEYDYTKYDCEVANIIRYADCDIEKMVDYIIKLQEQIYKDERIILHHPFNNQIKLRAIKNLTFRSGQKYNEFLNYIFLIDSDNKFPMIIIQIHNFFDYIITNEGVIKFKNIYGGVTEWSIGGVYDVISRFPISDLFFCEKRVFFYFSQCRPYHYFHEILYFSLVLFKRQNSFRYIQTGREFFVPKGFAMIPNDGDYVLIRPLCMVNYGVDYVLNFVLQESLEDYHILTDKDQLKQDYNLTIWLGLPGERRAWLEQIEGTANMLKHFNKYFKKIKVYVDGMTAYDGGRKDFPENKVLFDKVVDVARKLFLEEYNKNIIFAFEDLRDLASSSIANEEKLVVFKSLAGYDYRTKICYCEDCDIAISDSGTTGLIPFKFHQKPGVIFYGSKEPWYREWSKRVLSNNAQKIIDDELLLQVNIKSQSVWSYHIPYQHIYNLAAEVLEELSGENKLKVKNLKMHRLDVPPVELIAKQYELEQTLKIKLPIESVALYSELEKQINTLVLHNNTTLNQALENINRNNALSSTLQHSLQTKDQTIKNLENKIKDIEYRLRFKTAKARIQNHLAYKLGNALIENSKSIFGYIRMPYILSYIRDMHRLEQKRYEENIKKYPEFTLPPLEDYSDYEEALKEKECFTYRLGLALMRADKEWYKGGYIKFYFESRKMKKELLQRKVNE